MSLRPLFVNATLKADIEAAEAVSADLNARAAANQPVIDSELFPSTAAALDTLLRSVLAADNATSFTAPPPDTAWLERGCTAPLAAAIDNAADYLRNNATAYLAAPENLSATDGANTFDALGRLMSLLDSIVSGVRDAALADLGTIPPSDYASIIGVAEAIASEV